jgi:hypothetical protein
MTASEVVENVVLEALHRVVEALHRLACVRPPPRHFRVLLGVPILPSASASTFTVATLTILPSAFTIVFTDTIHGRQQNGHD